MRLPWSRTGVQDAGNQTAPAVLTRHKLQSGADPTSALRYHRPRRSADLKSTRRALESYHSGNHDGVVTLSRQ